MSESKRKDNGQKVRRELFFEALYKDVPMSEAKLSSGEQDLRRRIRSTEPSPVRPLVWRLFAAGSLAAVAAATILYLSVWQTDKATSPVPKRSSQIAKVDKERPTPSTKHVQLGVETIVWFGEKVAANTDENNGRIALDRGRLLAKVKPGEVKVLLVQTPLGTVTVHGTVFSVAAQEGQVSVRLYRGKVSFDHSGGTLQIKTGKSLTFFKDSRVEERAISIVDVMGDLLIAEPYVREHPDGRIQVPDLLTMFEAMEKAPSPPEVEQTERPRRPRIIEPRDKQIIVERRDTAALVERDTAPSINPDEIREEELIGLIRDGFKKKNCEQVMEHATEYLDNYPVGTYADEVLYDKAYCQAYLGDLSGGKESLEIYFSKFRDGRYWENVKDILDE